MTLSAPPIAAEPTRVLVVDDEETIHVALGRVLRRLGFDVLSARDGHAALELAHGAAAPKVILLDLRMPGMDGHTLLRRLACMTPRPSVVVISGDGNMEDVIDVLRAGAVDYLRKPWNTAELMAAITRAIELYDERTLSEPPALVAGHPPDPPPPVRSGPSGEALFRDMLERLRRGEILLPATPSVLVSLRASVGAPGSDLDEIASKIQQDQRLSTDILRLANTAHYARLGRAVSVRAAVQRLGLRHVHNVVETLFLQGFFRPRDGAAGAVLTQLWRRSVARAISMRALSDLTPPHVQIDGDVAYLCGLMADVGASLLLWVDAERGSDLAGTPAGEPGGPNVLQRFHDELGATLLDRWGFESTVVGLARHHHHLTEPAGIPLAAVWKLAILANGLVTKLIGVADPTEHAPPTAAVIARCASDLQMSDGVLARLSGQLQSELTGIVQPVG